jgi:DNA-binding transcriptional LysR family regulator
VQISIKQLEAFVWVADLGSFRKAADRLNTTQPNVSSRIATLEGLLKQTLMERDAGSVRLTSKGVQLLDHARKVLRSLETFTEAASEASLIDGTLRLGVTEMIVHTWLSDFLKALSTTYPKLHVELTVDLSVNLERDLAARTLDLALQNGPFRQQMTGQLALGNYPLVWVASRGLGLRGIRNPTMDHIAKHPILTHSRDTRLYSETAAHFGKRKDLDVRLVPSSNLAACLHMTLNGMGVATLPAAMVSKELNSGELVCIDYNWQPDDLEFFARFDADRAPNFVAQAAQIAQEMAKTHAAIR